MWQCLKCGREFKNQNQDHFCGEPSKTIDAYIAAQPECVQPFLNQARDTIRAVEPFSLFWTPFREYILALQ